MAGSILVTIKKRGYKNVSAIRDSGFAAPDLSAPGSIGIASDTEAFAVQVGQLKSSMSVRPHAKNNAQYLNLYDKQGQQDKSGASADGTTYFHFGLMITTHSGKVKSIP